MKDIYLYGVVICIEHFVMVGALTCTNLLIVEGQGASFWEVIAVK